MKQTTKAALNSMIFFLAAVGVVSGMENNDREVTIINYLPFDVNFYIKNENGIKIIPDTTIQPQSKNNINEYVNTTEKLTAVNPYLNLPESTNNQTKTFNISCKAVIPQSDLTIRIYQDNLENIILRKELPNNLLIISLEKIVLVPNSNKRNVLIKYIYNNHSSSHELVELDFFCK